MKDTDRIITRHWILNEVNKMHLAGYSSVRMAHSSSTSARHTHKHTYAVYTSYTPSHHASCKRKDQDKRETKADQLDARDEGGLGMRVVISRGTL